MSKRIYPLSKPTMYAKAGPNDLIEMIPKQGWHSIYLSKNKLETIVESLLSADVIHISGETGVGKTNLIQTLQEVPQNIELVCRSMNWKYVPVVIFPIDTVKKETPGDWIERRSLDASTTYDEDSDLVKFLVEADQFRDQRKSFAWIREIGRSTSSNIAGGLLDIITKGNILLSNGRKINGDGIGWILDSNYVSASDGTGTYNLVTMDDALKSRPEANITIPRLPAEDEALVLAHIVREKLHMIPDMEIIAKIIDLGNQIRAQKEAGNLQSLSVPTLRSYKALYRKEKRLPHHGFRLNAEHTIMGNASKEDLNRCNVLVNQILGFNQDNEEGSVINNSLF